MDFRPRYGALVVIGCGPGIGTHIATLFGSKGFRKIFLMSRNLERLKDDAMIVSTVVPQASVEAVHIDLASTEIVKSALEGLTSRLSGIPLECVLLHAARSGSSKLLDWSVEDLQRDIQQSVVSSYAVVRWAIPHLLQIALRDDCKPALFVTCAALSDEMLSQSFSLGVCEAAQDKLINCCYRDYGQDRIHCALVMLHGRDQDGNLLCDAQKVAAKTWELYKQEKGGWRLKIDVDGGQQHDEIHENHV